MRGNPDHLLDDDARAIIIIHPGGLGDVLLSVSAIRILRASFSEHKVGLLAGSAVSHFLFACGEIDAWFPIEAQTLAALQIGQLAKKSRFWTWIERCDLLVAWMNDDEDGGVRKGLEQFSVPRIRLKSPFSPTLYATHQADRFLETIVDLIPTSGERRLPRQPEGMVLAFSSKVTQGETGKRAIAVLHPGSGSPHKCMPATTWKKLIEWMREKELEPVLLEGSADGRQIREIEAVAPSSCGKHSNPDLYRLAEWLAGVSVLVSHDSGIAHLAALMGIPTVVVFGPTDPCRWGPRGNHVRIVRGGACRCVGWEQVRACEAKLCLSVSWTNLTEAIQECLGLNSCRISGCEGQGSAALALSGPGGCVTVQRRFP